MSTLNVGPGQPFARLSDAIAASSDGDLIRIQAGTYTNDFATINKRLTIQGVGGMAKLVATEPAPNGKAILVTQNDVTLENIEMSGARVRDENGAAIRHENGSLTLNRVYVHHNENGLLAGDNASSRITISNSEFAFNGRGDGSTHGLYANKIANLTISGSYFHDASVGHEIKSRAAETLIEGNRIVNGPNGTASYNIDLPNGGRATVRNNLIEKGPNAQNPNAIHFGGEGTPYSDSNLLVSGNTIVSDRSGATVVLNQTGANATVTNNQIFGFGSQVLQGAGSASSNTTPSSRPAVDTSPVNFGAAPASTPVSTPTVTAAAAPSSESGSDTLVLRLSADSWEGNPRFVVRVDGQTLGDAQEVTAAHASGQSQSFTFKGNFGAGSHTVGVTFLNDAYAGTAATDRNLYVDGITLNGAAVPNASATLYSAGNVNFTAAGAVTGGAALSAPTDALTLRLSGDSWQGHSKFVVRMDGQVLGGPQEVSAAHASGQSQEFTFNGAFGNGPHAVTVSFLNDAYAGTAATDRNLYVDGITFNGAAVPNASAALHSAGDANFTVGGGSAGSAAVASQPSGPYVLEGPTWPDRDLTWSFATKTYDQNAGSPFSNPITGAYQASIRQAMQKWSAVSGVTFNEVADAPSRDGAADIRIGFADLNTAGTGVLGYANYRYVDGSSKTFLPNSTVRIADPSSTPLEAKADGSFQYSGYSATLYQVALHEVGHALGLGHSPDENSIMSGSLNSTTKDLNGTDIAGAQRLFGGSGAAVTASADEPAGSSGDALIGVDGGSPEDVQAVTAARTLGLSPTLAFACDHDHDEVSHVMAGRYASGAPGEVAGADGILREDLGGLYADAPAPAGVPAWVSMIPASSTPGGVLATPGAGESYEALLAEPKLGVSLFG